MRAPHPLRTRRCARCGEEALELTMSYFNTDLLCLECEQKERAHPQYADAKLAEIEAVQRGDFFFPGIGKPRDL